MARATLAQLHDAMRAAVAERDLPGYLSLVSMMRRDYPEAAAALAVELAEVHNRG